MVGHGLFNENLSARQSIPPDEILVKKAPREPKIMHIFAIALGIPW